MDMDLYRYTTAATVVILMMAAVKMKKLRRKEKTRRLWVKNWLNRRSAGKGILNMLDNELKTEDPNAYRNFLRMNSSQFEYLLSKISAIVDKKDTTMRECVSSRNKLETTLRFLATGETFRSLMYSTRIHESTISRFVPEICRTICKVLEETYLKTPRNAEQWMAISKQFDDMWQFPHCLGALDGRHIEFRAPISTGAYYYNYKVSADCDSGYEASSTLESIPTSSSLSSHQTLSPDTTDSRYIPDSLSSLSEIFLNTSTITHAKTPSTSSSPHDNEEMTGVEDHHSSSQHLHLTTDTSQDSSLENDVYDDDIDDDDDIMNDDDDDNVSTVSHLSDLSGLSELSGQDWKPMSGSMIWIQKQMQSGANPRTLLNELGVDLADVPQYIDNVTLWKFVINLLAEPPRRNKLRHVNTLDDVVRLVKGAQNIIVLTGAGVSVSCGIPDFRSRDGIYSRLTIDFPDLPDPQAMFDINYFTQDPRPFFKFARDIYPGKFKPSPGHNFIKMLETHGKLLRNYTQNIDTLEKVANIEKVIECHGSFATATCTKCGYKVTADAIRDTVLAQRIPFCERCHPGRGSQISLTSSNDQQKTPDFNDHQCKNAQTNDGSTEPEKEASIGYQNFVSSGIMKPDIVFFGEGLPDTFHEAMAEDKNRCDLLLVIGSSLKVRPVALIPNSLPAHVPQILINREPLPHYHFDVELLGDCDVIINHLCHLLGGVWKEGVIDENMLDQATHLLPLKETSSEDEDDDDDNEEQIVPQSAYNDSSSRKRKREASECADSQHVDNCEAIENNKTEPKSSSFCTTQIEIEGDENRIVGEIGVSISEQNLCRPPSSPTCNKCCHNASTKLSSSSATENSLITKDVLLGNDGTVYSTTCYCVSSSSSSNNFSTQNTKSIISDPSASLCSSIIGTTEDDMKSIKERHISIDSARDSGIGENSNLTTDLDQMKYDDMSSTDEYPEPGTMNRQQQQFHNTRAAAAANTSSISSGNGSDSKNADKVENPITSTGTFSPPPPSSDLKGYWQPKIKKCLTDRLPPHSFYHIKPSRYVFPGAEIFYDPDEKFEFLNEDEDDPEEDGESSGSSLKNDSSDDENSDDDSDLGESETASADNSNCNQDF